MEELEYMREIYDFPPELDFCSDSFDPLSALDSYIHIPFPNAKTYNNLAEYYSHTFLKKDDLRKVEKDRPYDRDYSFYYDTLGIDRKAQERYERRRLDKIRNMKYAGWRSAKLKKKLPKLDDDPNREPCRSYPPLQSTKIIQIGSSLRKRKLFPIFNPQNKNSETNLENELNEFFENEIKEDSFSVSHLNGERPSEMSIIKSGQKMGPHSFDSPSVDHSKTNIENPLNDFMKNTKEDRNYTSHLNKKRPNKKNVGDQGSEKHSQTFDSPGTDHSKTNIKNQLDKNTRDDRNYTSYQNEKRLSKMSVGDSGPEKHSQTFDSNTVNHVVSKRSIYQQRFFKNSSYDFKRKYENKYRHYRRSNFEQNRKSRFREDSRSECRDPHVRKNKRSS